MAVDHNRKVYMFLPAENVLEAKYLFFIIIDLTAYTFCTIIQDQIYNYLTILGC